MAAAVELHRENASGFEKSRSLILIRGHVPTLKELLSGLPPFGGTVTEDISVACRRAGILGEVDDWLAERIRPMADDETNVTRQNVEMAVRQHLVRRGLFDGNSLDLVLRLAWAGCILGSQLSFRFLSAHLVGSDDVASRVYLEGLNAHLETTGRMERQDRTLVPERRFLTEPYDGWNEEIRDRGLVTLRNLVNLASREATEDAASPRPKGTKLSQVRKAKVEDVHETETEPETHAGPSVVVLAELPKPAGIRDAGEIATLFPRIAGRHLPLVLLEGVGSIRASLADRWPHAAEAIERCLTGMRDGRPAGIGGKPLLLVGSPGSGKSTLASEIGRAMGIATLVYDCGAASDSAFAGTSAQWSTRRASIPLSHVARSGQANPMVVLDEIEKASSSSTNGSFPNTILPFLNRDTARDLFDIGLETKVDLSNVVYVATANDPDVLSGPLRDRFRIVRVPDPSPEHIAVHARHLALRYARDNGLHPAFVPPFGQDELDTMARCWTNRSFRQLEEIVRTTIEFRASFGRQ